MATIVVATAGATTIPSSFFVVVDQQGANDVPAQSDLTQMGRDDSDSTLFKLFWSWDAVDFTSQTGDACALFDFNNNGNIDVAVCDEIHNSGTSVVQNPVAPNHGSPPAPAQPPYVFRCADSTNDRCSIPTDAQPYIPGTDISSGTLNGLVYGGNLITDTDPFDSSAPNGPGAAYPNDSTIQINILKSYLATLAGNLGAKYPAITNPTPTLVNVCSYPSAGNGGNNNPFDCIVNPGGGFLKIVKVASGADASTTAFPFTVNPGSISKSITGSGDTGSFTVPIGTAYSVAETVPSNWSLTGASCKLEDGTTVTGSLSGNTVSGITVQSGKLTTCTFNDTENNPHLSITKVATETGFSKVGDVIHYTITATNDGNVTLSNVDVTDSQVSDLACTPTTPVSSLAPGSSISCTASHTITQADLDAGSFYNQACVDDGTGGAAQACDDVTTPGTQTPHLSITKVATETGFSKVGDVIHYTITATNDGNVTLSNVDVTDSQVSDLACTPTTPVSSLAPGSSISCTASHTITQADLDAGSFYNQACVDDGTGGAAQACDDVTTPSVAKTAQITPTATTCQQFLAGASPDLNAVTYGVKANKINSVSPGVFFYYSKITAPSSSFTITVPETNLLNWRVILIQQGQALLYDASCTKLGITGTQNATTGTVTYTVNGATAGATYVVGIKYDPGSLVGQPVSKSGGKYPTNTYSYSTSIDGGDIASSHDSIDVTPR
jgi:uncharacterized repeat protein (TIGR01451 family)